MVQTSVFKNNKTQAVRLPKDFAFPDDVKSVEVIAVGNARIIMPVDSLWDTFFDQHSVSNDFMVDRHQPVQQERERF